KAFYLDQMGFTLEVDSTNGPDFRIVQLTPQGSACSIAIGKGIGPMAPGTLHGLHLCVDDIVAAHAELVGRGADVSEPFHFAAAGQTDGVDPERKSYSTFMTLNDPDGNTWLVQEVKRDWVLRQVKRDEVAA
ncbi:MAG: VOC family protein, partial [Chloroflexota bacterium]